ncbi:MAG: hypothetical protein EAY68_04365, partial [Bacteroidetes bacterium]
MWYLLCILDAQIVFMRFITPLSVAYLAEIIGAEIIGDATAYATGINEIHKVETGDICFYFMNFVDASSIGSSINEIHKVETGDICFVDHP